MLSGIDAGLKVASGSLGFVTIWGVNIMRLWVLQTMPVILIT